MKPNAEATCCQAFRDAWLNGIQPPIEQFLPATYDARRLPTLVELVRIDMQMRIHGVPTNQAAEPQTLAETLSADDYLVRFDELNTAELREQLRREYERLTGNGPLLATQCELADTDGSAASPLVEGSQRYRLIAEHARGGMGVIWRVVDNKLGREVALKRLPASMAEHLTTRQRFVSEARVTAQLEHPGIVPIYDLAETENGEPSYTMKLLRGQTLTKAIERFHELKADDRQRTVQRVRLVEIFLTICRTVAYAHAQQVIHRDLKPENILLGEFGETAVLDWGLAKMLDDANGPSPSPSQEGPAKPESTSDTSPVTADFQATRRGAVLGTPAYMPPEQARGEAASTANDIYSLGAVLYHMLTGRPPFSATSLTELLDQVINVIPVRPRSVVSDTPLPLEAICLKAMQKEASKRYDSAADLVGDLERYLADEPIACYRESWAERSFRWMRKHRQWVVATVATLLLVTTTTTAAVLVRQANQASRFAEQRRVQQARSAADTSDAVATQRIHSGDFPSSLEVLDRATQQLAGVTELNDLRNALTEKAGRAKQLAEFQRRYRQLEHLAMTNESDAAYRTAQQCLDVLGIREGRGEWWNELPSSDLQEQQQVKLKEQVLGILLQLAAIHATNAFVEFSAINAKANYFTVKTNESVKRKIKVAETYLNRAERYRATTAADYLRLNIKLAAGDVSFINWIRQWVSLAPQEPNSAVDCYFTAVVYLASQQTTEGLKAFIAGAQSLGSKSKLRDAQQEGERLMLKAIRLQPDHYAAHYQVGVMMNTRGNYQAAHQALNACVRIAPEAAEAYSGRATALLVKSVAVVDEEWQQRIREQGLEDAARALELAPRNGYILTEVGMIKCLLGDFSSGIGDLLLGLDLSSLRFTGKTAFNEALKASLQNSMDLTGDLGANPHLTAVYKATVALDFGELQSAWDLVSEVPDNHPAYYRVLALRAIAAHLLVQDGQDWSRLQPGLDAETALSWTEQSLQRSPGFYRAWRAKILLLQRLERHQQALAAVNGAQQYADEYADWQQFELIWLASRSLQEMGRDADAEQAQKQAKAISDIYYEHVTQQSE